MTTLEQELSDVFSKQIAENNKSLGQIDPQLPASTPTEPAAVATPTETPNVAPSVQASTPATSQEVKVVDLNAVVDGWDVSGSVSTQPAAPTAPAPVTTPTISEFIEVAKVLNLGDIKGKEDFVKVAQELKLKATTLEKLPSDLAKAVEIANQGGNYLEYLNVSVVDWSKEDPVVLYENYVIDRYTDPNGQVDSEKVDKLLDRMDEDEKELRGRELQSQYIMIQNQQKSAIEAQTKYAQTQFENGLKVAVDSIDNIGGFKLSPSHKTELYNEILRGEDVKHQDLKSRVEAAAIRKYWAKMDEYRKTQIKNATLRQTLEEATFPKLPNSTSPAAPESRSEKYGAKDYIDELAKLRGFQQ